MAPSGAHPRNPRLAFPITSLNQRRFRQLQRIGYRNGLHEWFGVRPKKITRGLAAFPKHNIKFSLLPFGMMAFCLIRTFGRIIQEKARLIQVQALAPFCVILRASRPQDLCHEICQNSAAPLRALPPPPAIYTSHVPGSYSFSFSNDAFSPLSSNGERPRHIALWKSGRWACKTTPDIHKMWWRSEKGRDWRRQRKPQRAVSRPRAVVIVIK